MREKLNAKLKQNKAFTLVEMLVVVAVMVILLGISMIGLREFMVSLQMTEVDNYAKTIYLEAQNQLIAEKVEGGMPGLAKLFEQERPENRLTVIPQDYTYDAGDAEWQNLYQVSKSDTYSNYLISTESYIYDAEGDYIIEFNPQTGMVYGVFYWNKDTAINYEEDVVKLVDRTREERTDARIGYYGGMSTEVVDGSFALDQQVEVINSEELYLRVSYDASARLLAYHDSSLIVEYVISDEHGNSWTGRIHQGNIYNQNDHVDVVNAGRRLDLYILLDSMQSGYGLADIAVETDAVTGVKQCNLVLDDELTISVTSEYDHGSDYCVESNIDAPIKCSGLYANSSQKTQTEDVAQSHIVQIEKVRHLRNLDFLNPAQNLQIEITDHVDFNSDEYAWAFVKDASGVITGVSFDDTDTDDIEALRPIDVFVPISNSNVFESGAGTVTIDGKDSTIQNFIIAGAADNVGLFSVLKNVDVNNVILQDVMVNGAGCSNVGALAGQMIGGNLINCGVHLTTSQLSNDGVKTFYSQMEAVEGDYINEMDRRVNTYRVVGVSNVGGLVGVLNSVDVTGGFAAIMVNATGDNVGGFAGIAANDVLLNGTRESHRIVNSYSSGDVTGNRNVGGFIGNISNMMVGGTVTEEGVTTNTGVYSTSDVYANANMGAFVGYSSGSAYTACTGYGAVMLHNGVNEVDHVGGGGFVGINGNGNTYQPSCSYLEQTDYNNKVGNKGLVSAKGYNEYLAGTANDLPTGGSYPYDTNLFHTSFPFAVHWAEQPHHYGDWPTQYVINTSLVYYEKYDNGNGNYAYGFYCITYIAGSENQWLLNTLQNRECIEDGYAILTKFNLESVDVDLQIGSVMKADTDPNSPLLLEKTLTEADGSLVRLVQQKEVVFEACDNDGNVLIGEGADTFKVAGMYLYQLPYELQCTERSGVNNFYDRLVLNNGVIYDSDPYAEDIIVVDDLTFFYCPHFAKTAINPNLSRNEDLSVVTLTNPVEVAVRSARQLNALGRFSYYWNTRLGYEENLSFVQETDINFGTYVKEYCGKEFNLLAFDQPYSNQPIGELEQNEDGYGSFMNDYDGKSNKIIDYCVKSDRQYVGLFGEVYKAGGATKSQIQNVVMVVSDKNAGNIPNYNVEGIAAKDQNNAGLILGTFLDYSGASKGDRLRTGVGALVGSDYTIGQTEGDASVFTIQNCAAAGYTVAYELDTVGNRDASQIRTPQQPLGIAIGGLVGYSRGNIASSSAVNTVKFITKENYTGNNAALFLGGFAGSLYYGTIQNCYSGGTVEVDNGAGSYGNGMYYVMRMRIGGFCPGWLDAPGVSLRNPDEYIRYYDVYSYTTIASEVWEIREEARKTTTFNHFMPVVGRMAVSYKEDVWVGLFQWEDKWDTDSEKGTGVRVPGMSYTLTSIYEEAVDKNSGEANNYFVKNGNDGRTCTYISYDHLSDLAWVLANTDNIMRSGKGEAAYSYPVSSFLKSMAYPFPAVVTDVNGNYVHYGDWPVREEVVTTQFPAYYECYSDGTYGYFMMRDDGSVENYLVFANDTVQVDALPGDEKEIIEAGYGWFTMDESAKASAKFQTTIKNGEDGGLYYYYLLKVEDWGSIGVDVNANDRCEFLDFAFSTVKVVSGEVVGAVADNVKRIYINPNYACALSMNETDLGTQAKPLQVRTQTQLSSVSNMNEPDIYMQMTHSISLDESYAAIHVKTSQVFDGGSQAGFAIRNAKATIFQNNTGTIQNVLAANGSITTEQNTAMFVHTNAGVITNAKIMDSTITSTGEVAGFVYKNIGHIENSGMHATVSYAGAAVTGAKAYGFAVENTGTITHAYAVGMVNGSTQAAGFAGSNTGTISLSYANALVRADAGISTAAGFAISAGSVQNCYASGSVTGVDAYGFMKDGMAETCYTISVIDGAAKHGFADASAVANNCYWAYDVEAGYNMSLVPDINQPPAGAITLRALMREIADYEATEAPAVPYSEVLGNRYPYPAVGIAHFGDWMPPTVEIHDTNMDDEWRIDLMNGRYKYAGIFYYERYMDGSYGFYLKGVSQRNAVIDLEIYALADSEEYVVTSGYGVFYQDTRWDIFFDENLINDVTDFEANILDGFQLDGVENAYQYRYLNKDGLKDAFTRTLYYSPVINNTITIWGSEITNAKN